MKRVRAIIRGGRRAIQRLDGAGDIVEVVIRTGSFGLVRPCVGCDKRKAAINAILPNPWAAPKESAP